MTGEFPAQRASNAETFDDVIMFLFFSHKAKHMLLGVVDKLVKSFPLLLEWT